MEFDPKDDLKFYVTTAGNDSTRNQDRLKIGVNECKHLNVIDFDDNDDPETPVREPVK